MSTIGDTKRHNVLRFDYTLNIADAPKAQSASFLRAVDLLKQAVEKDPDFAEAWANLAAASIVNG